MYPVRLLTRGGFLQAHTSRPEQKLFRIWQPFIDNNLVFFVRKPISFYFVLHSICFPSTKLDCCKIHKKYFPFRLNISEKVVMFTQWHFCLLQTLLLAQEDRDCIAVDRVDAFDTIHHLHKFFEQFSAECRMYWKKNGLEWPINNSLPRTILDYILD